MSLLSEKATVEPYRVTDLETLLIERNEGRVTRADQWILLYDPKTDLCWVDPPQNNKIVEYQTWKPQYFSTLTPALQQQYFPFQPNLTGKRVWMDATFAASPLQNVSFASLQGPRNYQEDRIDYRRRKKWTAAAVYDGHGDSKVSEFLKDQLLPRLLNELATINPSMDSEIKTIVEKLWLEVDQEIFRVSSLEKVGSTAIVLLQNGTNYWLINVGDSRGVILNNLGEIALQSVDDKPNRTDEQKRIKDAKGNVIYDGRAWRVNGVLSTSRAFGDAQVARDQNGKLSGYGPVSVIPTIQLIRIGNSSKPKAFLASDGVFDVIKNDELKTYNSAEAVVDAANAKGSQDNMSAIFISLN